MVEGGWWVHQWADRPVDRRLDQALHPEHTKEAVTPNSAVQLWCTLAKAKVALTQACPSTHCHRRGHQDTSQRATRKANLGPHHPRSRRGEGASPPFPSAPWDPAPRAAGMEGEGPGTPWEGRVLSPAPGQGPVCQMWLHKKGNGQPREGDMVTATEPLPGTVCTPHAHKHTPCTPHVHTLYAHHTCTPMCTCHTCICAHVHSIFTPLSHTCMPCVLSHTTHMQIPHTHHTQYTPNTCTHTRTQSMHILYTCAHTRL